MTSSEIVQAALQLGIGGCMAAAVIWLVWHLITRTFPSMTSMFQAELNLQRQSAKEDRAEERKQYHQRSAEMREDIRKLFEQLHQHHQQVIGEFRIMRQALRDICDEDIDSGEIEKPKPQPPQPRQRRPGSSGEIRALPPPKPPEEK